VLVEGVHYATLPKDGYGNVLYYVLYGIFCSAYIASRRTCWRFRFAGSIYYDERRDIVYVLRRVIVGVHMRYPIGECDDVIFRFDSMRHVTVGFRFDSIRHATVGLSRHGRISRFET